MPDSQTDVIPMGLKELLETLSNVHGVSGYEDSARSRIQEMVRPYVDDIMVDRMGNLIATKKGGSPVLMLAAHMDEIGLMVKYVDEKGFLRFTKTGGWFDQTLLNQRMIVHTEKGHFTGVIGSKPPHAMKEEDRKKAVEADNMFIDVGATSKEDAEKIGIVAGCPVTLDTEFRVLGNDRVTGKAFDNRAGCAMLIEALRRMGELDVKATVHAAFTVQEEVGLKGAKTSAFGLNPDVALATDVTITGDHPGIEKKDSAMEMGKGPAITVSDAGGRGIITHPSVLRWLKQTASENSIPYQLEVGEGGTTDASAIHLTREGIPSGVVSIPSRYIHTPVSVLSLADLEAGTRLIAHAAATVNKFF